MKHKGIIRILSLACAALTLCGALSGCAASFEERTSFAMGSVLDVKMYAPAKQADVLFERVTENVNRADRCLSANDPSSEISALNVNGSVNASEYTRKALKEMVKLCDLLDGTVDVTLGAVTRLWGFSSDAPRRPSYAEIKDALETKDLKKILIDDENEMIVLGEGQRLDPGAFGKGIALDEAFDALHSMAYPAVVTFGGSVLLFGKPVNGKSWTVGVRDPFKGENDYFATLSLTPGEGEYAGFLSTSGSYEKNFTEDGVLYHHILSPVTGYPVETDLVSVTVYAPAGVTSDALSTACFVNGLNERTLQWLDNFGAEAVFVYSDRSYSVTDGLRDAFTLTDDAFTMREYEG